VNPRNREGARADKLHKIGEISFRGILQSTRPYRVNPEPALSTLVQYYRATLGQYTTPPSDPRVYAIHHTTLVITISCKGQLRPRAALHRRVAAGGEEGGRKLHVCGGGAGLTRGILQSTRPYREHLSDTLFRRSLFIDAAV